jgi:glycosyltransferase involved in cell wall biosynthesis
VVRYGLLKSESPTRILIPKALLERTLRELLKPEKEILLRHVELLEDDPLWQRINSVVKRHNIASWAYFECINWKYRRERILLLCLEPIVYGFALSPLPRFNCAGLLFRPTFYYSRRKMLSPGIKSWLLFTAKWIVSYSMRLRPGITRVFTLDPLAEEHAHGRWGAKKFRCVPDPFGPEPGVPRPIGSRKNKPKETSRLLLAGTLGPRKGVKESVDALEALPEPMRRKLVLTVIGEPEFPHGDYLHTALNRAKLLGVQVEEDLRFVSAAEIDIAMEATDVVLVAYRGFKGSSGIVIRAAHFGKPVISTDDGLMAHFVRKYQLGQAIDVGNPSVYANCLQQYLQTGTMPGFNAQSAREYADSSQPQSFVDRMLDF